MASGRPGLSRSPIPISEYDIDRIKDFLNLHGINSKKGLTQYNLSEMEQLPHDILHDLDTSVQIADVVYEPIRENIIFQLAELSSSTQSLRARLLSYHPHCSETPVEYTPQEGPLSFTLSSDCIHPITGICNKCIPSRSVIENMNPIHPVS